MSEARAQQDLNQVYSQIGVRGTLGTADVMGTAGIVPIGADPATGAQYVYNLGPAGSVSLGDITGGTINLIGSISTIGTMPAISIGESTGGTLDLVGTVGTIPGVGVLTTLTNLVNGTIQNSGTTTGVGTLSNIGVIHSAGTVRAGTIQINSKPTKTVISIGSTWGTSSGTAGTLISAPGASNSIFINELSISNNGTGSLEAGLSFGTAQTGTAVVRKLTMGGNGGIEVPFPNAVGGHFSNTPLVMWTSGSGTATFNLSYWTEAT